jgi:hypothetical protein
VAAAVHGDQLAAGELGQPGTAGVRANGVLIAVDHQDRAVQSPG